MPSVALNTPTTVDRLNDEAWPKRDANPREARAFADEAKILAETTGYTLGVGRSFTTSSFLHYRAGRFAEGLNEAFVALEVLEAAQDTLWLSRLYNNLGLLHDGIGERAQGMSWLLKQLELSRRTGNEQQEATALHDLGFFAVNTAQGRNYFYKARDLFYKVGDGWGVALSCMNLAEIHTNQGDFDTALQLIHEAMSQKNHEGEAVEKAYISQTLGYVYAAQGKYDEALVHYRSALKFTADGLGNINFVPRVYLELGDIYQKINRFDVALLHLEKGLHLAEEMDFRVVIYDAHRSLSSYYKTTGNFEKALEHFETFHRLKETIFNSDNEQKMRAMEVIHRTETARQEAAIQQLKNLELHEHIQHLEELNAQVKALSISDPLTGLYNRRYLFDYLAGLEGTQHLSIAIFDIDHFKNINDTYTHFIGDDVLRGLGALLTTFLRGTDIAARFGGEEFIIAFGYTTLEHATLACERLRQTVETNLWSDEYPDLKATISVGVVSGVAKDYETLLQNADKKLYEAKNLGRNRVVA